MSERTWTLIELLNTAHHYLDEKGIENPRRNAEAMLGKVLALPRIELYLQHDRPLSDEQVSEFRELMKRRMKHEPLQLILGTVEFFGVTLETAPGILIPRPETEELAERVAGELSRHGKQAELRLLDIGTGTGCLAVSLAARITGLRVDAVDVDFEAVRCASRNAEMNRVAERVRVVHADIFSERFHAAVNSPYDAVISNPPYVSEKEYAHLEPEVRDHEARHALVAAENGLAFYRRIADLLPALMKPGGLLGIEIGIGQHTTVTEILRPVLGPLVVHRDAQGIERIIMGQLLLEQPSNIMSS